eukprot:tig00020800_g13738.t1
MSDSPAARAQIPGGGKLVISSRKSLDRVNESFCILGNSRSFGDDSQLGLFFEGKTVNALLDSPTVGTVKPGSLVEVRQDSSVQTALKTLDEHKIHALAVYDESTAGGFMGLGGKKRKRYVGIVSIHDLLAFAMIHPLADPSSSRGGDLSEASIKKMLKENSEFLKLPVRKAMESTARGPTLWMCEAHDLLADVVRAFATGAHRAMVRYGPPDADEASVARPTRMVSQTDIARYLIANANALPEHMDRCTAFEASTKNPFCIRSRDRAIEGFRVMHDKNIRAVGVIDEDTKKLVANLSASDLRKVDKETIGNLNYPVTFFLNKAWGAIRQPVACGDRTTIREALQIMLQQHLHRIWVVSPTGEPLGVLSLTDVIRVFAPRLPQNARIVAAPGYR